MSAKVGAFVAAVCSFLTLGVPSAAVAKPVIVSTTMTAEYLTINGSGFLPGSPSILLGASELPDVPT